MSSHAILGEIPRRRPLWLAALIGTAVPYLIGSVAMVAWSMWNNPNAHPTGTDFIDYYRVALWMGAYAAFPSALLMLGLLLVLSEPRKSAPLWVWLVAGLVATTPMALALWAVSHLGDCFEHCSSERVMLVPPLILYGFGLLGAAIGWSVRYGRARA